MLDESRKVAIELYHVIINSPDPYLRKLMYKTLDNKESWKEKYFPKVDTPYDFYEYPAAPYSISLDKGSYYDTEFTRAFGINYLSRIIGSDQQFLDGEEPKQRKILKLDRTLGEKFFGAKAGRENQYCINIAEICRRLPAIINDKSKDRSLLKKSVKSTFGTPGRPEFAIILDKAVLSDYGDAFESRSLSIPEKEHVLNKGIDPESVVVVADLVSLRTLAPVINFPGASHYLPKEQQI